MHFTIFLSAFVCATCKIHISNHCSRKHGAGPTVNRAVSSVPSIENPQLATQGIILGPALQGWSGCYSSLQHKVAEHPWVPRSPGPARIPESRVLRSLLDCPWRELAAVRSEVLTTELLNQQLLTAFQRAFAIKSGNLHTHSFHPSFSLSLPPVRQAVSLTQWDVSTRRWKSRA